MDYPYCFMIPSMILLGKLSGIEGILWAGPVADWRNLQMYCRMKGMLRVEITYEHTKNRRCHRLY